VLRKEKKKTRSSVHRIAKGCHIKTLDCQAFSAVLAQEPLKLLRRPWRWAAEAGTGRHDEPYDPLVFPLYAMMSLPVSWALELLAACHALYSAAPLRPAFPSLLLFLLCACVCAFGLRKEHMRMLSVRAAANFHLSSLLPLCSCWLALHRALDTRHWTRSSRSIGMHAD